MIVKHEEYTIYVHSPIGRGKCQFGLDEPWYCQNDGSFAVHIKNDRDEPITSYSNICSAHLLQVVIAQITEY